MTEKKNASLNLHKLSELMIRFSDKQKQIAENMAMHHKEVDQKRDAALLSDFMEVLQGIASDPKALFETQKVFFTDYMDIAASFAQKLFMGNAALQSTAPAEKDSRFSSMEWDKIPYFQFVKESYLLTSKLMNSTVANVKGIDIKKKKRVEFITRQITEALSPSNFLLTNPEILKITFETGGGNIVEGINNFLDDINSFDGSLDIKMTDPSAFELGVNIATTPGSVVFQNDLIQLIQYAPSTQKVYATPVLISPPFINKYYILDINENNSFVKWLVSQGYTVFVISWVNPDISHKDKTYADYMVQGHIEALDAISTITRQPKVSAIGYCTGGTLLATTAAWLTAKGEDRFASLTYMATAMDFSDPGDLGYFLDEEQVHAVIDDINEAGYLDGRHLAKTFNLLRPNELVWSYAVTNYLKGRRPLPFDILFWNSDSTNLPARMYSFYLQRMYLENRLKDPGGIILNDIPIDLGVIACPSYFLSTEDDHIVLWRSAYKGALLHKGSVRFVLGGSGHVAGVVNPPAKHKYGYRTSGLLPEKPEQWLESSVWNAGSWWIDWHNWHMPYAGALVSQRIPGKGKFKEIEPAPGSYVKKPCAPQS